MNKTRLYLLAGNGSAADWWDDLLPHIQHHTPQPLELPGFGNNAAAAFCHHAERRSDLAGAFCPIR